MKCHFLQFWWAVRESFPQLSELIFRMLLSFATTHLCESGFSALVHIKKKARNQRKVEHDKRLVVSTPNTQPRISKLPYGCTVNRRIENDCEIRLLFEINCYKMHFCGSNVVVVRCILQEMSFVVIIMVIISYVLKQEQEGSLCVKIQKGVTNRKWLRNTACIRRYGLPLNATFSKWPPSQINWPPLS